MNPLRLPCSFSYNECAEIEYVRGKCRDSSRAYAYGEALSVELSLPRTVGVTDVVLSLYSENDLIREVKGAWRSLDCGKDVYRFYLGRPDVGLYFFSIRIESAVGSLFAYPKYDKVSLSESSDCPRFQLTVYKRRNWKGRTRPDIIYQIFVDRFSSSGRAHPKGDAIIVDDWSDGVPEYPEYPGAPLKNNTFYGGDLFGIAKKLEHLSSLGVTVIYLTPIFESVSNHKYDTGNYLKVDEMFGGEKALKALIKKAKKLGIGIILDGVFNHTGDNSVYFNKYGSYPSLGAYQSKASPYYSWYSFQSHPDDYTSWWGIEILPRINTDVESCRSFFTGKGGVIETYAKMGILGFRLDVVDELSDAFIKDIKNVLSSHNPECMLYGEVWEDASNKIAYDKRKKYYLGDELDGVMNYPLRKGLLDYLTDKGTSSLRYALTDIILNAPKEIRNSQMNLLGTHDTERVLTVLGGGASGDEPNSVLRSKRLSECDRKIAIKRLKLTYSILTMLPGSPMIYYGDESGLEGYKDPFNRMPYPWGKEEQDLLEHFKSLGRLRQSLPMLADADFKLIHLDDELLVFKRSKSGKAIIIVASRSEHTFSVDADRLSCIHGKYDVEPHSMSVFIPKHNLDYIEIGRLIARQKI